VVENRGDDLDHGRGSDAPPSGFGPDVDAALGDFGPSGAVEWDDDRDGAEPLTVGAVVVSAGVLDPVVAV
jgi:hypothetical protein